MENDHPGAVIDDEQPFLLLDRLVTNRARGDAVVAPGVIRPASINGAGSNQPEVLHLPEDFDPELGNFYPDSGGAIVGKWQYFVLSTFAAEEKGNPGNPDFIIVKATESPFHDTIIGIVNVKVDEVDPRAGALQLSNYMDFVTSKRRDPKLRGYLITGSMVYVCAFNKAGVDAEWALVDEYPIDLDRLMKELYEIATLYWNV